jgi:hypothetical protein
MVTSQSLKSLLDDKAAQIEEAVSGVGEEKAKQSPAAGEWCVREVLYHLSGDVDETFAQGIARFINEDKPELDLTPGTVYISAEREKVPVAKLAASVAAQYRELGEYVAGLSEADLARIGRIGFLKQVRGNDEITLAEWASVIGNYHLNQHIEQLRALAK